ncbi:MULTISPECIES: trans-sulfuration enzyme family protein [Halocynthiibacter]|uniref:PLP-dependent aspartate aminotransferase family protein n=1 Tax=Halocynthiibacter halioticoli TaxID=2986804 RepID=A0AAE3LUD8_9RHOB|nr:MULTISPECIES: PLP-dependent aspartate aminotransferase family protein [Halocynthiibacter]MCV6823800.1 PLP-dependent aspartate aminotransferase family protein [Halocynthiibacter halioticoli]MCW4056801.1 PLP-dependent aspartate aminotransferase family protein [Halocynthiibacter sp. SDUM655004]
MANHQKPATIAAQAAGQTDQTTGGVTPAIHPATTFLRDENYDLVAPQNTYLRDQNENARAAEDVLKQLENAADTLLFPSGMAAIAAMFRSLPNRATVLVQSGIYWGATKWIRDFCARREITLHEADASETDAFTAQISAQKPDLVMIETPSNPWLKISDITAIATATHAANGLLMVDSTAATPVLSRPLDLGADVVMHSATKAINGHSDVLAGVLSCADAEADFWRTIQTDRHDAGAVIGPFEAWLLLRGMRTLTLRVERMSQSALTLAEKLETHPKVERVFYPGLPSHPAHELAKSQMNGGFGGLLSVCVKGGAREALAVAGKLSLFHRATSLGGVESLVEHRHTIEPHTGIPENLLRLSVGIEDVGDLWADLENALAQV